MAKLCHPDAKATMHATNKVTDFREVSEAYEIMGRYYATRTKLIDDLPLYDNRWVTDEEDYLYE